MLLYFLNLYIIHNSTKKYNAREETRCALESLESQLSNAHHVCHVALLLFVLCQIVYNFQSWVSELDAKNPI